MESKVKKLAPVAFVGAGPGDIELLTLKAVRYLEHAEVVLVDRLVNPEILKFVSQQAVIEHVGKGVDIISTPQEEINKKLLDYARQGKNIVRLKGGDPLVFARVQDEIMALKKAQVEYEIVPGITAAFACAAEARLPITQRGEYRMFTIITGHDSDGFPQYDWHALVANNQPLVFYMGVKYRHNIQGHLLAAGMSAQTEVTIVENGSRPDCKILTSNLVKFVSDMDKNDIKGPAVIYIGLNPML